MKTKEYLKCNKNSIVQKENTFFWYEIYIPALERECNKLLPYVINCSNYFIEHGISKKSLHDFISKSKIFLSGNKETIPIGAMAIMARLGLSKEFMKNNLKINFRSKNLILELSICFWNFIKNNLPMPYNIRYDNGIFLTDKLSHERAKQMISFALSGRWRSLKQNNIVNIITEKLKLNNIPFKTELELKHFGCIRRWDIVIPNEIDPLIVLEATYLSSTSSGQNDKVKTIYENCKTLRKHHPTCEIWGLCDGSAWVKRRQATKIFVSAVDYMITGKHIEEFVTNAREICQ